MPPGFSSHALFPLKFCCSHAQLKGLGSNDVVMQQPSEKVRVVHTVTVESVQHARVRRDYLPVVACEACLPVLAHTPSFLFDFVARTRSLKALVRTMW